MLPQRLMAVLILSLFTVVTGWAQTEPGASPPGFEFPRAYFVELHGAPTADGGSLSGLAAEKEAFRGAARKAGIAFRERYRFDKLWNGFSLEVSPLDLARLASLREVKALYPVDAVEPPRAEPAAELDLFTSVVQTQVDIAQNELGLTGRGVRVAIIDTGVDYDHPDLGGCFGPGCKVAAGHDFVGDGDPNAIFGSDPMPDPFPDDACIGHGTHVAGIVAADGPQVRGIAPEATLLAYRIFGCNVATDIDIAVAAMERALEDGADIVSMSFGAPGAWPSHPWAQAATRLVRQGVVVVTSAGNSGTSGLYFSGAPGVGDRVISTAAFSNTHSNYLAFSVSPDSQKIHFVRANATAPPVSGTFPLARTGSVASTFDACGPFAPAPGSLAGKIALIRMGGCSSYEKARNAQAAGAAAVLLWNNTNVNFPAVQNLAGPVPITVPAAVLSGASGLLLDGRLAAGPVSLTWSAEILSIPSNTGYQLAGFSSSGPSPTLTLKPNLGAPGTGIFSTHPLELGAYATFNGTSMAAPHVSGAVALLLQARPDTPAGAVQTLLQNTAAPQIFFADTGLGRLEVVHRQGAGLIRIADAIRSAVKVEPSELALGESEAGPAVRTLTIENEGPAAVTYDLSHARAMATAGTRVFFTTYVDSTPDVRFGASSVTVPAGGSATVEVTIGAPADLADGGLYGGYLVLTPRESGAGLGGLHVPYLGFKGDYQAAPVLTALPNGIPSLIKLAPFGQLLLQPNGATYSMQGDDFPMVGYHLDRPAQAIYMDVFDADTGKAWHRIPELPLPSRPSSPGSTTLYFWSGHTVHGKNRLLTVPDGRYVFRLTAIKPLGDETNPAHVDTWTSPVITIDRN